MTGREKSSDGAQFQAGSIDITYYTDPLCCWSWAFEPEWRKLQYEYEGLLTWNYRMGGLLPSWNNYADDLNAVSRPLQMGPVWMHASHLSGMDMDNSIWMRDPPESSYPACIAVKCAQLQSMEYAEQYLRLLREAVMLKGINIAKYDELVKLADALAKQSAGFDVEIFQQHLSGREGLESFKADMQQVRNYNITRFPTMIFRVHDRPSVLMVGYRPYDALLEVLQQVAPGIKPLRKVMSGKEYKLHWRTITNREVEEALK